MEITCHVPAQLGKYRIQALDNSIIITFIGLLGQHQEEIDYRELNPKIIHGKTGDRGWSNFGYFFIFLDLPILFLQKFFSREVFFILLAPFLIFAAIAFILRYIQFEYAGFRSNTGGPSVFVRLQGRNREERERMLEYLAKKIQQANSSKDK